MKALSLSLVAVSLLSTVALGQESSSRFPQPSQSPPLVQDHASTFQEGVLRGAADHIRAVGEYDYNKATSILILEEARRANIANGLYYAETYYAKQNLHRAQMAARKRPRLTPGEISKPEVAPVSLRMQAPFGDPSQPGFVWPAAFNHPSLSGARGRLALFFAQRSPTNSGPQSESYLRIQNSTSEIRMMLKDLVRELPPMAYVEARNFLDRANYEASLPVQVQVAAIN
jgi:hypothetical protein